MKRIEATVQTTKITAVTEALNDIVGGFTILEGKGRGSGIRQEIRSGRGTGTITAEYNEIVTVIAVVNDSDVDKISTAIADAQLLQEKEGWNCSCYQCGKCSEYRI